MLLRPVFDKMLFGLFLRYPQNKSEQIHPLPGVPYPVNREAGPGIPSHDRRDYPGYDSGFRKCCLYGSDQKMRWETLSHFPGPASGTGNDTGKTDCRSRKCLPENSWSGQARERLWESTRNGAMGSDRHSDFNHNRPVRFFLSAGRNCTGDRNRSGQPKSVHTGCQGLPGCPQIPLTACPYEKT